MKKICFMLFFFVLVLSSSAKAMIIIDTGQPFNSGLTVPPSGITQRLFHTSQQFAGKITLNNNTQITDIETFFINTRNDNGSVFSFHILLYPDVSNAPEASIELFKTKAIVDIYDTDGYDWSGAHNLDWNVNAGTYWVGLEPRGSLQLPNASLDERSGVSGFMPSPVPNPLENYAFRGYTRGPFDGIYNVNPDLSIGLRVYGNLVGSTTVPEPASIFLIGTGLAGAFFRRKLKVGKMSIVRS
jgi:hypothetical protein